jgi:hypothetical protein
VPGYYAGAPGPGGTVTAPQPSPPRGEPAAPLVPLPRVEEADFPHGLNALLVCAKNARVILVRRGLSPDQRNAEIRRVLAQAGKLLLVLLALACVPAGVALVLIHRFGDHVVAVAVAAAVAAACAVAGCPPHSHHARRRADTVQQCPAWLTAACNQDRGPRR